MKRQIAGLIVGVLFVLSSAAGCGTDSGDDLSTDYSVIIGEISETDTEIPQEAYEDIIHYLTDGMVSAKDVVYQVEDTEITAEEYFYYLTYEEYIYVYNYYYTYYTTPDLTEEDSDGTTMPSMIWWRRGMKRRKSHPPV